ncbi:M16 family metallopeptidase [Pseudoxanthomonas mexicana]|uniref:M16 family metallopeptidase n=1 Tax=Pseudoxanthomonas mexicana TaxID=128785 RepID=UPI00398B4F9C
MNCNRRILALCAALALTLGSAPALWADAPTAPAIVLPKGTSAGPSVEGISEYTLPNGLRVLLFPDPSKPTVTVNVVYGVGSAHENYGETGMAHLLEHLVFKGTPSVANIPEEFKKRGISYNGTTWLDRTNYFGSFPANDQTLDWLLALEADRMVNSHIARRDLDSEMTVVRNEMEIGENNPGRVFQQRLRSQAYLWHNYGKSTIGNRADVENVPIERLQAFYRTWYQPDNATVIVAGRFDPQRVLATVNKHFGKLKRPARQLPPKYTVEPTQDGEREVNVRRVGDMHLVGLAYHVPSVAHPDNAPLQVLASILGHTPSGRLHKALVETKLAAGSGSGADAFVDPGLLVFMAVPAKDGDPAQVEKALLEQVEALAARPFTEEEVAAARQRLGNNFELSFNDVNRIATALSEYIATGDWRLMFLQRDAVEKVGVDDVNRVARTYLVPSNRTLARFIPTQQPVRAEIAAAPSAASLVAGYTGRAAVAAGEAFDPTPQNILARTRTVTVGDGLKVSLLPKKTRGGMVTATLVFRFGDEAAITGRTDAAGYAGNLLLRGSKSLTREQIDKRFDDLKANVSVDGGAQNAYISVTTKRENLAEALRLAADVLRNPAFSESEFEQLRTQAITSLEASRQEPSRFAGEAMQKHFNHWQAGHPYAFRSLDERLAAVRALKLEDVRAFHRDFYGTATGEVAIVGDFDADALTQELQALFAGWKSARPFARIADGHRPVATVRESFETPDKANAVLLARAGFALNADDPDHPALVVANRVFGGGGMASRLGNRIRQQEGLSYGVGSQIGIDDQDDDSSLLIQASAAPENMARLEAAMREELEHFVRDGISAQELDDARDGLLTAYANGRANDGSVAGLLRRDLYLGRTLQWTAGFEEAIRKLTPEQVNAAIRRHLRPEQLSVFVAGDFAGAGKREKQ